MIVTKVPEMKGAVGALVAGNSEVKQLVTGKAQGNRKQFLIKRGFFKTLGVNAIWPGDIFYLS